MTARWWPPALRYVPYGDLGDQPNVVVDGSGNPATVLTLSHWPQAPCPPDLRRDLSAESAFAYLDHPSLHGAAEVVSNNHFDQDGLVSVHALSSPEAALDDRELLLRVARIGDFAVDTGIEHDRRAARLSMVISRMNDYDDALERLPEMIEHPERYQDLWGDEDAQLERDLAWMASGAVAIEEVPELDLTVVELPADTQSGGGHRFGGRWFDRVHPIALHHHIDGFTVLLGQGDWWELRYRYESWVQYVSRPVRQRVDLAPLAAELTALETGGATWEADPVRELTPGLHLGPDQSTSLSPATIRSLVEQALRAGTPAWDPFAP